MSKHRVAWIGGFPPPSKIAQQIPPDCELVGVCDILEEKLDRARRERPDLFVTDDFRAIARMDGCDSVISFTPNETHRDIAVACLEGGKNVFIEKPMGITLEQGREILEAEKQSGKVVAVDLEFRYSRIGQTVRGIIDSGEIGEVRQVEVDHHRGGWLNDTPQGRYRTKRRTSGFFKMEAIHMIDLLRYWMGDFAACRVFSAPNTLAHYEFPDNYTVMIEFQSGARGRFSGSHNKVGYSAGTDIERGASQGHQFRLALAGTRGVVHVDLWRGFINVLRHAASPPGTDSVAPEFERCIDFRGLSNPGAAGHDMGGCRYEFLKRMAAGREPYQAAADAFRSEQIAYALDNCEDLNGGRIDCTDWIGDR